VSSNVVMADNASGHRGVLGLCWLVYGLMRMVMAAWLVFVNGTATVMFGALLNRVPDPFTLMSAFHFLYTAMVVLSVVCGALGILAGLALLAGQRSGRRLAILSGVLSLSNLPLGATLGIWTLVALLPMSAVQPATETG
jgi:hypothetical protein